MLKILKVICISLLIYNCENIKYNKNMEKKDVKASLIKKDIHLRISEEKDDSNNISLNILKKEALHNFKELAKKDIIAAAEVYDELIKLSEERFKVPFEGFDKKIRWKLFVIKMKRKLRMLNRTCTCQLTISILETTLRILRPIVNGIATYLCYEYFKELFWQKIDCLENYYYEEDNCYKYETLQSCLDTGTICYSSPQDYEYLFLGIF